MMSPIMDAFLHFKKVSNGMDVSTPSGPGDCTPSGLGDCTPSGPGDCTPSGPGDCTPSGPGDCTPSVSTGTFHNGAVMSVSQCLPSGSIQG